MTGSPSKEARVMLRRTAVALSLLLAVAGCGAGGADPAPDSAVVAVAQERRGDVRITKILVFVVENHSMKQMRKSMPRVFRFAQDNAYATRYFAITHPSLPNYIAMVSGSTHGVDDDLPPAYHGLEGRTVFGQALANGKTAGIYADAMTTNCKLVNGGRYAVRHNPWTYFVDERDACEQYDVPVSQLVTDIDAGTLPNVGFVIPDVRHDAHDAALAVADRWIGRRIRLIRGGADWRSGQLAVVVTADEDDHNSGNRVLTVVGSRYQQQRVVTRRLTHYSLTRAIEDVLGVRHLRKARRATSLTRAFRMVT